MNWSKVVITLQFVSNVSTLLLIVRLRSLWLRDSSHSSRSFGGWLQSFRGWRDVITSFRLLLPRGCSRRLRGPGLRPTSIFTFGGRFASKIVRFRLLCFRSRPLLLSFCWLGTWSSPDLWAGPCISCKASCFRSPCLWIICCPPYWPHFLSSSCWYKFRLSWHWGKICFWLGTYQEDYLWDG